MFPPQGGIVVSLSTAVAQSPARVDVDTRSMLQARLRRRPCARVPVTHIFVLHSQTLLVSPAMDGFLIAGNAITFGSIVRILYVAFMAFLVVAKVHS